jgi:spore coat protein CotH
MFRIFAWCFLVLIFLTGCSQYPAPTVKEIPFQPVKYQAGLTDDASVLFATDGVYRIEVDVAYDLFDWDNSNDVDYVYVASDHVSPAVFKFYWDEDGNGDPVTITGIGMRGRGGWSFENAEKKKYKICFPDERNEFFGLSRLNLNSNWGDNSMMREKLAYDFFNYAGVPSGRTAYTRLYVNNQYFGLYLIVEQMNNTFIRTRFGNPVGNCYKDNWNELTACSPDVNDYLSSTANPLPSLQLMTNEEFPNIDDMVDFIDILNNTPDANFAERIEDYFLVYEFLSALSINALLGLIDDYWYYAHNFFLYNYYGRFMWVPWDLDHCFGAMWAGFEVEHSDIYAFAPRNTDWSEGERPLIDRILAVPEFCDYYRKCVKYYIENYFNEDNLYPRIEELKALIMEAAIEDPEMNLSEALITEAIETNLAWVHAIKPYITARKAYAWAEVQDAY